jgi:hypothetical protein
MTVFRRHIIAFVIPLFLFTLAPIVARAQVAWVKDLDTALKQAARENKFIVLDISASW